MERKLIEAAREAVDLCPVKACFLVEKKAAWFAYDQLPTERKARIREALNRSCIQPLHEVYVYSAEADQFACYSSEALFHDIRMIWSGIDDHYVYDDSAAWILILYHTDAIAVFKCSE